MTQFIALNICIPKSSEAHTRGLHSKIGFKFKNKKKQGVIGPAGKMGGKKWWNGHFLN